MYAKSFTERVRGRIAAGTWTQQLSFMPVVMAIAVAALPFTLEQRFASPELSGAPSAEAAPVGTAVNTNIVKAAVRAITPDERRYTAVADYMARKFLVSRQVVLDLVKTAHVVGRQYNVDPMLLVAVIAVESSFNPIAESVAGAKGLMQIIPRYHREKFAEFGGEQAAFEPRINIAVGAKIIREYLQASSGNLFTALQTYAGALPDRDAVYTHKVLNEKDRLDALMGVPKTARVGQAAQPQLPSATAVNSVPAPSGRMQMNIEPHPPTILQPAITPPDGATNPVKTGEPLAAVLLPAEPVAIAAVRP